MGLFLLAAALHAWLRPAPWRLGLLLGLGALARPDALLWLPVFLAATTDRRPRWRAAAGFAAVVLPWALVSLIWLRSFVPDTFALKTAESWDGWGFANGPLM